MQHSRSRQSPSGGLSSGSNAFRHGGSHKHKYGTTVSSTPSHTTRTSKRASGTCTSGDRYSRSPRTSSRYMESSPPSPVGASGSHHYHHRRSPRMRQRTRGDSRRRSPSSASSESSASRSRSPTSRDLKHKREEYIKKISETSLFAELVKDRHKRQKALKEIIERQEENSNSNSNGALTINDNSSSVDGNTPNAADGRSALEVEHQQRRQQLPMGFKLWVASRIWTSTTFPCQTSRTILWFRIRLQTPMFRTVSRS